MATSQSDLETYISILKQCKPLPLFQLEKLIVKAKEVLSAEANVPNVRSPVTVCGDIHGQFYDLKELFKAHAKPKAQASRSYSCRLPSIIVGEKVCMGIAGQFCNCLLQVLFLHSDYINMLV